MVVERKAQIGGREVSFETGRVAGLADGAVSARYGETVVLATAVSPLAARRASTFSR